MDLAKIIAELRVELQCLNTAIASIEELARVQNIADGEAPPPSPRETERGPTEPGPENSPPEKRRRGRPRKSEAQGPADAAQPIVPDSAQATDAAAASAA